MWDKFFDSWAGWAFGLLQTAITAVFGFLWGRARTQKKELEGRLTKIEERLDKSEQIDRLILYRYIDEDYEVCMERGHISTTRYNNIVKMGKEFASIGGNEPAVDNMIDKLKDLPHKTPGQGE